MPTEFPVMKARSQATTKQRAKALGRAPVARRAPRGVASAGAKIARPSAKEAAWDDDSRFSARLVCYAMIEDAQQVERVARAAAAILDMENPSKAQKAACKRWLRALQRVRHPLKQFGDKQPWRYGLAVFAMTYESAKILLLELAKNFRQRRDADEQAEDIDLARAAVDALLPVVDLTVGQCLPRFAPLRKNLVGWLLSQVASPEKVGRIEVEHEAQAMVAKLFRVSDRKVQDIVARSRKYEQDEAPLLFVDVEKM